MRNLTKLAMIEGNAEFAILAGLVLRSGGDLLQAKHFAENEPRVPERVRMIVREAVAAGSTDPASWAAGLVPSYGIGSTAFLESLRERSVFDYALEWMRQIPHKTQAIATTLVANGSAVAEGAMKPISRLQLAAVALEELKATCIVVLSEELARLAGEGATGFLSGELRRGVSFATDQIFLAALALAGSTPIASSGNDADSISVDVAAMLDTMTLTAESRLVMAVHSDIAKRLVTMIASDGRPIFPDFGLEGGLIYSIPTRVTDALDEGEIVMFDGTRIAASPGIVTLDSASHASLQLNDAPSAGAQNLTSLWQTNARAIRVERVFGAEVITDGAVASMTGVTWGEPSA